MLSFTAVVVALLGLLLLEERPSPRQWLSIGLATAGVLLYLK